MPNITGRQVNYTTEAKINALKYVVLCGKAVTVAAKELGINHSTLVKWIGSDWGKLKMAEFKLEHGQQLMTKTAAKMDQIIETKIGQFEVQVKVIKDLEDLMGVCIDRFNELLPKTKKIRDVTEAFDSISNIYIKIINSNKENNSNNDNKEEKDSFILNLIDKQMVVRPIQLRELVDNED